MRLLQLSNLHRTTSPNQVTKVKMDINDNPADGRLTCSCCPNCYYVPNLNAIPPEIGNHLCLFLTAYDLLQLPLVCPSLAADAQRELRSRKEEHSGRILTTSTNNLIGGTDAIGRHCPGLLLLYRCRTTVCPNSHCPLPQCPALPLTSTFPVLRLTKPLLPRQQETCADKLQAVSLPAFSQSNNTPRCYRLYTEDPTEQAALILFKADNDR